MGEIQDTGSKPIEYDVVVMVELEENGEVKVRSNRTYQPNHQRCLGLKQNNHKRLLKFIDVEKNFKFR